LRELDDITGKSDKKTGCDPKGDNFDLQKKTLRVFRTNTAQGKDSHFDSLVVPVQTLILPKFEVFAESQTRFFAKVSDNQITFETGPDGRATSLILHKGRRDMPSARLP
jgi:hypothetical protein